LLVPTIDNRSDAEKQGYGRHAAGGVHFWSPWGTIAGKAVKHAFEAIENVTQTGHLKLPNQTYTLGSIRDCHADQQHPKQLVKFTAICFKLGIFRTAEKYRDTRIPEEAAVMKLGVDSFAAIVPGAISGVRSSPADRIADLLEEVEAADRADFDVFGIGEHHRKDFADSAPVILAVAAARTTEKRLTSAVTVLSAADPVRVFQQFATLDLISKGRAEMQ
jgi:hypothetical protein